MTRATILCIAVLSVLAFATSASARGDLPEEMIKWLQPPDYCDGLDLQSQWDPNDSEPDVIKADDWFCLDGQAITDIHWWGSYLHDETFTPERFYLIVYENDAMGAGPADDLPGDRLWYKEVLFSDVHETFTGVVDVLEGGLTEKVYYYSVYLDPEDWFRQQQGEKYWLSIVAKRPDICDTPIWGWHTTCGQPDVEGLSNAVTGKVITDAIIAEGNPDQWEHMEGEAREYNMAFSLTTIPEPATLTLIGVGLVGLFAFRRKRQ